jgi:hypothetical protein
MLYDFAESHAAWQLCEGHEEDFVEMVAGASHVPRDFYGGEDFKTWGKNSRSCWRLQVIRRHEANGLAGSQSISGDPFGKELRDSWSLKNQSAFPYCPAQDM